MSATNAASERSFSAMRRLYTYLRTNVTKQFESHNGSPYS